MKVWMAIRMVSNLMPLLRNAANDVGILFGASSHHKKSGAYSITPKNI